MSNQEKLTYISNSNIIDNRNATTYGNIALLRNAKNYYNQDKLYATSGSAGIDFMYIDAEPIIIKPNEHCLVPLGFKIALPNNYFLAITPRSGLALKHRISIINSPGIVDSDYRDEVKAIIENRGKNDFIINAGDRICQGLILFAPKPKIEFITEEEFNKNTTERTGGFGSTGINMKNNS